MIQEPKSGRNAEVAFMPEHIATRLAEYFQSKQLSPDDRVFPLCYTAARNLVSRLDLTSSSSFIIIYDE